MAHKSSLSVDQLKQVASEFTGATLIIDGKNLAHRMAHAVKDNAKVALVKAVQGICFVIDVFKPHKVVMAWDDSREDLWRTKEYPAYKEKRKYDPVHAEVVHYLQDVLINVAEHFGIHVLWVKTQEADDMIAATCHAVDDTVIIVSNDGDMIQLLTFDNVVIFDPLQRRIITNNSIDRFKIENSAKLKALEGDDSDNIVGYIGIGEVKSARILKNGNLDEFLATCGAEKYHFNLSMVDLLNTPYLTGNIGIVKEELNRELAVNAAEAVKIAISKRASTSDAWPSDLARHMRRVKEQWQSK